ncbi:hypothetical protein BH09MYX1_BH09MYX1_41230 [soil metagenome]
MSYAASCMTIRRLFAYSICVLGLTSTTACRGAKPIKTASAAGTVAPREIRRTLVERRPATDLPGWETSLYLIEYPPGAIAPVHDHPVIGVGLVLEGRFESAFGDEPIVEVRAGEGFVDKAGITHRVFRNPSSDHVLRFVVAYTLRVGESPLRL